MLSPYRLNVDAIKKKYITPRANTNVMKARGIRASEGVNGTILASSVVPVRQTNDMIHAKYSIIDLVGCFNERQSLMIVSYHASHAAGMARRTHTFQKMPVRDCCAS
jgi:hypothetical protein